MTGEVLAEADEVLSREKGASAQRARRQQRRDRGRPRATASRCSVTAWSISTGFRDYTGFTAEELGIKEKVSFAVLKEIIDSGVSGDELKKTVQTRIHDLIPKTIVVDDMLASICYLLNLGPRRRRGG